MAKDILVVDDEEDIRELVSGILEDEGFSVRKAGNSDAALGLVGERRPSLVRIARIGCASSASACPRT